MAIDVRNIGAVYKVLGKTWLKTLQNGLIHVSRPREFNDPFDCSLACTGQFTEKFKRDWAAAINIDRNHSGFDREMAEWESDYRHDLADRAMFDFMTRILCVSSAEISKSDELLMWDHWFLYEERSVGLKFILEKMPWVRLYQTSLDEATYSYGANNWMSHGYD